MDQRYAQSIKNLLIIDLSILKYLVGLHTVINQPIDQFFAWVVLTLQNRDFMADLVMWLLHLCVTLFNLSESY